MTASVVLAVLLSAVDPATAWWMPKCPLHLLTGLSCPGCGMQRFLHAMLHGHPLEALHYNYFLVLALPYVLLLTVEWALPYGHVRDRLARLTGHRYVLWGYLAAFALWFVVRNVLCI